MNPWNTLQEHRTYIWMNEWIFYFPIDIISIIRHFIINIDINRDGYQKKQCLSSWLPFVCAVTSISNIFAHTFVMIVIIFGDFPVQGQALAAPLPWLSLWLVMGMVCQSFPLCCYFCARVRLNFVLHLIFQFWQSMKISWLQLLGAFRTWYGMAACYG